MNKLEDMSKAFDSLTGVCDNCGYTDDNIGRKECLMCGAKAYDVKLHVLDKDRPSFQKIYMNLAIDISKRSTCSRRQVGCVISSSDFRRILAVGYNGNASGLPNKCDAPNVSSGCGCIHAEENACISCVEPRSTKKIVFVTVFPCKMCAKIFVQLGGVKQIYYLDDYHDEEAKFVFDMAGIEFCRLL